MSTALLIQYSSISMLNFLVLWYAFCGNMLHRHSCSGIQLLSRISWSHARCYVSNTLRKSIVAMKTYDLFAKLLPIHFSDHVPWRSMAMLEFPRVSHFQTCSNYDHRVKPVVFKENLFLYQVFPT